MPIPECLSIESLHARYRSLELTPAGLVEQLLDAAARETRHVWITLLAREQLMAYAHALEMRDMAALPLYGIPFAIKDNIDLAGIPTTAGCPEFTYLPERSATVVERLIRAGAIPLGKTNLDQFATGLVGVRTPYGACGNAFDERFIAGGSSAGSAVAVSLGLVSFSLGTDTAGSGRVPAAFNNIIGLKPSTGRLSTRGVVPACRSLDCVSIFALTADDAAAVLGVAEGFDAADAYSEPLHDRGLSGFRCGVPRPDQLQFFGDAEVASGFDAAVSRLEALGAQQVTIDFASFLEAARLLYEGPWVAERYAAVGAFMECHPDAALAVTRQIIAGGKTPSAVAAFEGQYRLKELKRASEAVWSQVDLIVTPTAGTIYSIAEVESDPLRLNSNLGYYTNFMNLFGLAGVAVPAGFRADGLPYGITLVGPNSCDRALLGIADTLHRASVTTLGATGRPFTALTKRTHPGSSVLKSGHLALSVCGAHMAALPLNHQLLDRGAYLLQSTVTAPHYRLFALGGSAPARPGLIRVSAAGTTIALEVWAIPLEQVGSFLAGIPPPLGLGKIELGDGTVTVGFICENYAIESAVDISNHGGWRAYLQAGERPR